jgi:ubiquinone/menaquinone biosynthesis C-methylase UbiE
MEPALQRRVQRYGWDKASNYYEASWQKQLQPAQRKLLQLANVQPGEKVIDIACGTGLVTFEAVKETGERGFVWGTDISDKMVEFATAVAKEKKVDNIQFERMDAEELQVDDETYDVALCALGLMYVPDPFKALKEMYRVLKKGGRAVVAVWGKRANCGWADIFEIVDKRVSSEVCPMFFNLGNADVLRNILTKAGFDNIIVERLNSPLEYASGEEACIAAFAGGPVALPYHKFSNKIKEEVHAEYLASIRQFQNGNGYDVPGEFVVAAGYKIY